MVADELASAQPVEQSDAVGQHADQALRGGRVPPEVVTEELHRPGVRAQQAGQL